jgi:hypothetical protein
MADLHQLKHKKSHIRCEVRPLKDVSIQIYWDMALRRFASFTFLAENGDALVRSSPKLSSLPTLSLPAKPLEQLRMSFPSENDLYRPLNKNPLHNLSSWIWGVPS